MPQLTAQQANDLANQFLALAQAVGDFRYRHWRDLSATQHQRLASQHWSILNYGEDILALSTVLVMYDVSGSLSDIRTVTSKVKLTLDNLTDIQTGIKVTAAVVTLGAAIISENPLAIAIAIKALMEI